MWCVIGEKVVRRSTLGVALVTLAVGLLLASGALAQEFDGTVNLTSAPNPAGQGSVVTFTMQVSNIGTSPYPQAYSNILLPLYGFQPPGDEGYEGGCDLCPSTGEGCGLGNLNEDGSGQWYIWCDHYILAPGDVHTVTVSVPLLMEAPIMPMLLETSPTPRDFQFTIGDWSGSPASNYLALELENVPAQAVNDGTTIPEEGCQSLIGFTPGNIALMRRGTCEFGLKALNAEVVGAVAVVFMNQWPAGYVEGDQHGGLMDFGEGTFGAAVTIPTTFVTKEDGDLLVADYYAGGVNMSMGALVPAGDYTLRTRGVIFNNDYADANPGNDEMYDTLTVTQGAQAPVAAFSFAPAAPFVGDNVVFTDESTGGPTSWAWQFGDGGTSAVQNPTYAYGAAGTYTVTLTATNDLGSDTESHDVVVAEIPAGPTAAFSWAPLNPTAGEDVVFTDESTGTIVSWAWDFGDGNTATEQNPTHAFAADGTYTVTLTVGDGTATDSESHDITVGGAGPVYTDLYFFAAAGAGEGTAGSNWLTDADVNNAGTAAMNYQFWWLPRNTDNATPAASANFNLGAGMSVRYSDLVTTLGATDFGAVAVYADSADALLMSRTFNQSDNGTFGQAIPGYHSGMATPANTRVRVLFMTEDEDFRSNFGVLNTTATPITVNIELFGADGVSLGTDAIELPAYGNTQLNQVFEDFAPVVAGYVDVWTEAGAFLAYGSVVDNVTSDPTTVLPQ